MEGDEGYQITRAADHPGGIFAQTRDVSRPYCGAADCNRPDTWFINVRE